ncbi:MAG TPA: XdhC family protein [Vicinamibacterales bacterium]|nr:XdhC family protein [Vicinamibacterales bacterium]
MTETQCIIEAYRRATSENVYAALATVVRVEGSAYRRPGARMLVTEDGRTTGVVSGGCLEGDVRGRAARVMRTGQPTLVTYDTTTDEDVVWGLGLGCNGVVDVLIEPVSERTDHLVQFLEACSQSQQRAAFATVTRSDRSAEVAVGARVFLSPDGIIEANVGTAESVPLKQILADLHEAVRNGVSFVAQYEAEGNLEVFVEAVEPPLALVIFGAGADAVPLVTIAQRLGWLATVVDTHARGRSLERFADADAVLLCCPEELASRVTLLDSTAAVVMTHNYFHDLEVLNVLLDKPLRYVGCLGPRRRTERLLSQLRDPRAAQQARWCGRLHAPVGIDIGAETSSEIALSIAAEILAVIRGCNAAPLHTRQGAIHGNAPAFANDYVSRIADVSRPTSVACHVAGA